MITPRTPNSSRAPETHNYVTMTNMAAAGLGSSHWWGFSPALDLAAVYDGKMLKMIIHSTVADVPCCTFVSVTLLFQYVDAAKNAGKEALY